MTKDRDRTATVEQTSSQCSEGPVVSGLPIMRNALTIVARALPLSPLGRVAHSERPPEHLDGRLAPLSL